jgi:hypothetical protein
MNCVFQNGSICDAERSEASRYSQNETPSFHSGQALRFAQGDGSKSGICDRAQYSGRIRRAEIHWYEAHGIGKKEIKRICLD